MADDSRAEVPRTHRGAFFLVAVIVSLAAFAGGALLSHKYWKAPTDTPVTQASTPQDPSAPTTTNPPAAKQDVLATLKGDPTLSVFVSAVETVDMSDTLSGQGPYTVFAPNNAAFSTLPAGTLDAWMKPENKAAFTSVISYHVVPGTLLSKDLTNGQILKTLQGGDLTAVVDQGKLLIVDEKGNKATVVKNDIEASNGAVHVLDHVLMP